MGQDTQFYEYCPYVFLFFYISEISIDEKYVNGGIYMSISVSLLICLSVFLLIIALLIIGIVHITRRNANNTTDLVNNETELIIEIPKLFKVHFKQKKSPKAILISIARYPPYKINLSYPFLRHNESSID